MSCEKKVKKILGLIHKVNIMKLKLVFTEENFDPSKMILRSSQDSGLHLAVRTGNHNLVEWLLDSGFSIFLEHQNSDGKRPLHEASQLGFLDIVHLLLLKGAMVDPLKRADWTPLMLACTKGNLGIIQRLVKAGASLDFVNKDGWTPFHIACRNGATQVIQYFLELKNNIWKSESNNRRTPLHTAALHGNTTVVKILLENAQYDENERDCCGNTAVMEAVRSGHLECVRLFLTRKPDSLWLEDHMGRMTIHLAAEAGKEDIVRSLIEEYGVNVDTLTKKGETPLHFAAKEDHFNLLHLLISLGASLNPQNFMGRTPLWLAASARKSKSYNALLHHGAEDIPDLEGAPPSSFIDPQQVSTHRRMLPLER